MESLLKAAEEELEAQKEALPAEVPGGTDESAVEVEATVVEEVETVAAKGSAEEDKTDN